MNAKTIFIFTFATTIFFLLFLPKFEKKQYFFDPTPNSSQIDKVNYPYVQDSFTCNANVKFNGFKTVKGRLYSKNGNIGLYLKNEMLLGSNPDTFWFWSKRFNSNNVYYCKHEDYYKSRLKPPLSPLWILRCMNCTDYQGFETFQSKDSYKLRKKIVSPQLTPMYMIIVLDKDFIPKSYRLTDLNYKIIVESKIIKSMKYKDAYLPTSVHTYWPDENMTLDWTFYDYEFKNFSDDAFKMPEKLNKVNMANLSP